MSSGLRGKNISETALTWLKSLPRISLKNLREEPGQNVKYVS